MAYDEQTAERVRRVLSGRRNLVETRMMGGTCFLLSGVMCCGVTRSALMVRVGREAYPRMLGERHVRPLEFAGRRPVGFVLIDPAGYRTDTQLATWIARGVDVASTLPAKKAAVSKRRPKAAPG